ncbi:MAG: phenylalanine--tRNA ligase subunit beta [Paludibacteraceae bacterium]|nr:phenylalanine--tRNA ligase subunit beta [Paludibacteraceae bacterium]
MNISYKWLQRYLPLTEDPQTVAKHLTAIGLEVGTVEKIQSIKGGLEGLVVAKVLTCEAHPNSDHLHITTVSLKEGTEPVQIVCGAPNVAAGQKVICATIGTVLYSGDESFTIKRSKIRGVESMGMLCAEDEIGIGTSHDGIIVLPDDAVVGTPAKEYYHIEDDYLIEVDITPNRADACSHYGVARDLYAYYKAQGVDMILKKPSVEEFNVDNHSLPFEIRVENTQACPRYTGVSLSNVKVGDSPEWLQNALLSIGLRPINNVVDATNFVLHSFGQPMHAFDADMVDGHCIVVRNAKEGEKFVTLDEQEHTLTATELMICDENKPMCIAGVFGGLNSGVTRQTKNVFLESAYFDPVSIRKTARREQLQTDASFRYERGCDPNITEYALKYCALLIQQIGGGEVAMEILDRKACDFPPFEVELSLARTNALIGKTLEAETIETILKALEINIESKKSTQNDTVYQLRVPRYRVDVQRECDVVEDILRIYGYNNVEMTEKLVSNLSHSLQPDSFALQRRLSEQLTAQGFNEILNNSLTRMSYYADNSVYPLENCVKLLNPLSNDLAVMRQTLLYGGLESIQRNVNRKNTDLRFYEFGNCYHFKAQTDNASTVADCSPLSHYTEEMHLSLWLTGNKYAPSWVQPSEPTTFYTLHAIVLNLLRRIGINVDMLVYEEYANELFADGLKIFAPNGKQIGYMAVISSKVLSAFDIDNPVYYSDLDWKTILKLQKNYKPVITDLPRFPEVKRDLALLVDKSVCFADLKKAALQTERKLLRDVYLFDVYEGKTLEAGKKSYALSFILQDPNNTLKDKQIDNVMQRLQNTFQQQFGAKLR